MTIQWQEGDGKKSICVFVTVWREIVVIVMRVLLSGEGQWLCRGSTHVFFKLNSASWWWWGTSDIAKPLACRGGWMQGFVYASRSRTTLRHRQSVSRSVDEVMHLPLFPPCLSIYSFDFIHVDLWLMHADMKWCSSIVACIHKSVSVSCM